ncbi:MAG: ABC transporter ATP-binding protein [Syntrophorhabdaceae bacterium]|jgi:ABC-2 type transport system ATP-binding protein|nr:ABC transporter ATP-binding protein [Syntrophorhabdaceae bacterium]MDD5242868.1 ABC transporter ATP-binding protein [Syntrophorhabdaceae bacterium]
MNENIAVKTNNLTKVFDKNTAVENLNIEVRKGELFGLVGPDGAGKTTVMRLLAAIMQPTSGEAWVAGHSIIHEGEKIKERIGYMPQRFGLYEDLTVIENIHFYADLYGLSRKERPPRIERLLGFSNLTAFRDRLAGNLSGGMKQKLGLACALVHTPEVLFLDEPTCGVDPVSRRDFWRILYDLLKEEITVFVSTAYLDEAERCTRIGLIHKGAILMADEPARIKDTMGMPMIEVLSPDARGLKSIIANMAGVRSVNMYGDRLHIAVEKRDIIDTVLEEFRKRDLEIQGQREITPSLEDVFIFMVGNSS